MDKVDEASKNNSPQQQSNARNTLTLMGGTLGSRVTGFLRQSLITQLFDTVITDAFFVALRVPNLFRELLAEGALSNSFIPVYRTFKGAEAKRLSAALMGLLILANGVLLLLAYIGAPYIIDLLLLSQGSVDRELALRLTRIVFPFLFAISLSAWAMGILNAEERFFWPAWAPVALNVVSIIIMLLYPNSAFALAWGFVLGGVAQFVVQLPALLRGGHLHGFRLWHTGLAAVLLLMLPSVFTTSGRQVLNLVSANVLNLLPEGSVTAFQNADLFVSLALGLFSVSPALAYYSRLSAQAVDAPDKFNDTLVEGLQFISFLTVPAGLLLTVLARPAVEVVYDWFPLFGRAGASPALLQAMVAATVPLGFAIFPLGLNNLLVRTFYIRKRVRVLIIVTLATLTLQGVFYYLLYRPLGIAGLSWATVIASWLQFAGLLALVARAERFGVMHFLRHSLRVWLAAGLAALATSLLLYFLPPATFWGTYALYALIGTLIFSGFYAGLSLALGLPELKRFASRFRH